jgi:hypothetical protein
LARGQRNLGRAPGETHVANFLCRFIVGARRERRIAALERDIAHEQPIHELRGKLAGPGSIAGG